MKKIFEKTHILWNQRLGSGFYRMGIRAANGFENATPGQFVMIGLPLALDPLLKRPFSLFGLIKEDNKVVGFELMYKVVGKGTRLMSQLEKNDTLDLIGPLGNDFDVKGVSGRIYCVAGGVGVPPIRFLVEHLVSSGFSPDQLMVFLGARTITELFCQDELEGLGVPVVVSTDDGSKGRKGLVTDVLEPILIDARPDLICACGPHPMLKAVNRLAAKHRVSLKVSVESIMACGMGACLGCALPASDKKDPFRHVCIDGPVFDAHTIDLS